MEWVAWVIASAAISVTILTAVLSYHMYEIRRLRDWRHSLAQTIQTVVAHVGTIENRMKDITSILDDHQKRNDKMVSLIYENNSKVIEAVHANNKSVALLSQHLKVIQAKIDDT
jgi:uncharacterized coiled-coil DUF342 family protein